jgi:hypothetical protein
MPLLHGIMASFWMSRNFENITCHVSSAMCLRQRICKAGKRPEMEPEQICFTLLDFMFLLQSAFPIHLSSFPFFGTIFSTKVLGEPSEMNLLICREMYNDVQVIKHLLFGGTRV